MGQKYDPLKFSNWPPTAISELIVLEIAPFDPSLLGHSERSFNVILIGVSRNPERIVINHNVNQRQHYFRNLRTL